MAILIINYYYHSLSLRERLQELNRQSLSKLGQLGEMGTTSLHSPCLPLRQGSSPSY